MKYDLVGIDGNAFSIMSYVLNAMRNCRFSNEKQKEYQLKATNSDYDNLLRVSVEQINECNRIVEESEDDICADYYGGKLPTV